MKQLCIFVHKKIGKTMSDLKRSYVKYSEEQLNKIGNTVVFLAEKIPNLSKTKLLKLLYILDEFSIKKSGLPFFNITYKVWKFGPVSEELYIDLTSESVMLKNYIDKTNEYGHNYIVAKAKFNDDEFSLNDIELLEKVVKEFKNSTSNDLISFTHREKSPWYNTAKNNGVLEMLLNEEINNTELVIDMSELVAHDERKLNIYKEYQEIN